MLKLDWNADIIPGKAMFKLELGMDYFCVLDLLKTMEIAENVVQIPNARVMRTKNSVNNEVIFLKKIEDEKYDWQCDVAMLYFESDRLKSITAYLNDPYSYQGLVLGEVGLGGQIEKLKRKFVLEYDGANEVFHAVDKNGRIGLELHGSSCDLSVDPEQIVSAVRVFLTN